MIRPSSKEAGFRVATALAGDFLIAWGAEAMQFMVSQGLALAILAWLQTLPEFAVEAVIAWEAGKNPERSHLAIANLTGAIRLLLGLGWPMIYFVFAFFGRRRGEPGLRFLTWDMQAGDCLVFSALTVHGSGGNTAMTHRRAALSTRWLGDDAVWDPRPATATYYYEPEGVGLQPGDPVGGRHFPEMWRREA